MHGRCLDVASAGPRCHLGRAAPTSPHFPPPYPDTPPDRATAPPGSAEPLPTHEELRARTAAELRSGADRYRPFVDLEETGVLPPLNPADANAAVSRDPWDRYCDVQAAPGAWGGQPELQALAESLGRSIRVLCADAPAVDVAPSAPGAGGGGGGDPPSPLPPLSVCYLRHAVALGEHYQGTAPLVHRTLDASAAEFGFVPVGRGNGGGVDRTDDDCGDDDGARESEAPALRPEKGEATEHRLGGARDKGGPGPRRRMAEVEEGEEGW